MVVFLNSGPFLALDMICCVAGAQCGVLQLCACAVLLCFCGVEEDDPRPSTFARKEF